jgi:PAS domain S-box-containing protein
MSPSAPLKTSTSDDGQQERTPLWRSSKAWVISAGLLTLAETLLLLTLRFRQAKRRRIAASTIADLESASGVLQESEECFRVVANTAPVMIWISDATKQCTYFNQRWLDFTGRSLEAELGHGWVEGVHVDDLTRWLTTYEQAFERRERFEMQHRLRRYDGHYRWVLDIGVPRFRQDGSFAGYIGSAIDVTEHKAAEESLSTLTGRLLEAQEHERRRIARELHDDIGQRVAGLAIDIHTLKDVPHDSPADLRARAEQLFERTSAIASDLQALSHQLHSARLEHLGIVDATRSFCEEFAERQRVEVAFSHGGVPPSVSHSVSLCLFRVLQEGLSNALKHSGVRHFHVRLWGAPGIVGLAIRDSGVGFDSDAAMKNGHGLGLVSMRERVNLLKGTISITSKPNSGTQINVRLPLACGAASALTV